MSTVTCLLLIIQSKDEAMEFVEKASSGLDAAKKRAVRLSRIRDAALRADVQTNTGSVSTMFGAAAKLVPNIATTSLHLDAQRLQHSQPTVF